MITWNRFKRSLKEPLSQLALLYGVGSSSGTIDTIQDIDEWVSFYDFEYYDQDSFNNKYIPPLLVPSDRTDVDHYIKGSVNNKVLRIFRRTSICESRYGEFQSHKWIAYFELKNILPGFVIDGINGNKIDKNFSDFDKVKLEGGFSDKFSIYVAKGDHIDMMSVMTPDVMWSMYDGHDEVDIIVAGKRLWIMVDGGSDFDIAEAPYYDVARLDILISALTDIVPELEHQARTYKTKT